MSLGHGASVVRDGLVLHLDAANVKSYPGSGTTWYDLSGNGNNGTLVNGPVYVSDNKGGISFDGTNDYASIPYSSTVDITGTNITLQVIYKNNDLASGTHGDGLISKGSGSNDGQYEILTAPVGSQNKAYFRCYTMGFYTPGNILMDVGTPYMITCVLDQGYMKIYVNGEQDGTGEQKTGAIVSRTQPLIIGSRQLQAGSNSSAVNGTIYSAKVYNRALSQAEIKQNFEAIRGRYGI